MTRLSYRVEISPAAGRDLHKLQPDVLGVIRPVILSLADDPRPPGTKKLRGSERAYRIRTGPFRILFEIYDKRNLVVIMRVVRRSEVTYRR